MLSFPQFFSNQYYLNLVTSLYQTQVLQTTGELLFNNSTVFNINTTGIQVGALVFGTGIPPSTTVLEVGSNFVILSNNAMGGYFPPSFGFDTDSGLIYGFDGGIWTNYSGTTLLSFFFGPSPKMFAWLLANLQLGQDLAACMQGFATAFNLFGPTGQQAVGNQLDIIGNIVGQSRNVPILVANILNGGAGYVVGDVITVTQAYGGGIQMTYRVTSVTSGSVTGLLMLTPGYGYFIGDANTSGGSGTGLTVALGLLVLNDNDYRTLLQCTVMKNHWNGQVSNIPNICIAIPGTNYKVGDVVNVLQNQASGMTLLVNSVSSVGGVTSVSLQQAGVSYQIGNCNTSGGSGSGLVVYLPIAGIAAGNQQIGTIQQLWQLIFGVSGGSISIQDGGATATYNNSTIMSATVYVSFGPYTSTAISALAVNNYLIPRPQGVLYTYSITNTPIFSFDQSNSIFAGFDKGYFS